MKIRFRPREHYLPNDCWCDAMSLASGVPYKEVLDRFKDLQYDGGGLERRIVLGFLAAKGYRVYLFEEMEVRRAVTHFNSHDCEIVIGTKDHVFYVNNNTIYDNVEVEDRGEWLRMPVLEVLVREKKEVTK